ncbi:hypothetical protein P8452_69540 [Trifolium repens]|nr:hypothetical protein P8452_69540 [Trifolium repens]
MMGKFRLHFPENQTNANKRKSGSVFLIHIVENQGLIWTPSSSLFNKEDPESVRELVEASEDTSQSAPASQPVQPQQDIPANELAYASVGDNVAATPSDE